MSGNVNVIRNQQCDIESGEFFLTLMGEFSVLDRLLRAIYAGVAYFFDIVVI